VGHISKISDCVFTLEDARKKLSKLQQYKSTGVDDIGPKLLYIIHDEICVPCICYFIIHKMKIRARLLEKCKY